MPIQNALSAFGPCPWGTWKSTHRASAHAPNDSSILNETPFYFLTPFPPVSPRIRFIFLLFCRLLFLVCDSVTGWQRSSLSSGTTALLVFLFIRTTVFFSRNKNNNTGKFLGFSCSAVLPQKYRVLQNVKFVERTFIPPCSVFFVLNVSFLCVSR